MIIRAWLWLRSVLLHRSLEREMQAEMAEHIERSTERLIARGLAPGEARREAIREFGNVAYLQEEGRIARGAAWLGTLLSDLRFALRHFARNPLSTATIVAVLSIGIGINVVLFTIVYSFTDRPPSGIEASDELVRIRGTQLGVGGRVGRAFTLDEVKAYAGMEGHFSAVAAWTSQPVTVEAPGREEFTVTATFVTDDYFELLGVQPVLGSGLTGGAAQVAVLSHTAWTRSFAADPGILGRTITLNGVPVTIVGIAPPRFRGAIWEARNDLQAWLPLSSHRAVLPEVPDDAALFRVVARLRPGVTRESAGAAVAVVARRVSADLDRSPDPGLSEPGRDASADIAPLLVDNLEPGFDANARQVKLAFGVLGLLTLLVTCANTSALQTGLALARRREIAIRASLGASRVRLVRQLVTEGLLLATLAAVAAVGVSLAMVRIILAIVGALSFDLVFDGTTLAFTFGVALAAGLLFGLSPAVHATRVAIGGALKDSAASITGVRARLQRGLVVAQIALTQPLAVCVATLVVLGVFEYRENPPNPDGEYIVQLRLSSASAREAAASADARTGDPERLETDHLLEALRQLPGVTGAVYFPNRVPINQAAFTRPDSATAASGGDEPFYLVGRAVMPGQLDVLGLPVLLGRDLEPGDTAAFHGGAIPAIIGDDMARRVWGDGNPIGQQVRSVATGEEPLTLEVVGVYEEAADARGHLRNSFTVFVPPDPRVSGTAASRFIFVRTSNPAETMMPAIRATVREEVPRAAITELGTLASFENEERFVLRGAITLFSTGGLLVLLLSALGLYAVVAFAVAQRTGEIAVRMAIGGRTQRIVRQFASDGLRLSVIGIVVGLPLSILGLRILFRLSPEWPDISLPVVTSIVAVGVLLVASLATWIPASRAARVDPAVTLRRE